MSKILGVLYTLTGIVLQNDGSYFINKNLKIGLTEKDIIASLGKAEKKNLGISKGQITIVCIQSLNYRGFSIIFLDSTKSFIRIFKNEAKKVFKLEYDLDWMILIAELPSLK